VLTKAHRQEALSRAYVQAVAAQAGMSYNVRERDYGIDVMLCGIKRSGQGFMETGPYVDLQLKSTIRANVTATEVIYDLDVKNYELLRVVTKNRLRFLVVLVLPKSEKDWLNQTENELSVRQCAYWLSLEGWDEARPKSSIRISIPRQNVFSVSFLEELCKRVREGSR
jgi:hypothetical protein